MRKQQSESAALSKLHTSKGTGNNRIHTTGRVMMSWVISQRSVACEGSSYLRHFLFQIRRAGLFLLLQLRWWLVVGLLGLLFHSERGI